MTVMLGVLGDSYRRQLRRPQERPKVDVIIDKVAAVADEIGQRPFGVDFGVGGLPAPMPRISTSSAPGWMS